MIRRHDCYTATCGTPGCKPYDDHDYTPHFDSAEQAIDYLVTSCHWTNDGGVLRCEQCTARRQCEITGHQWATWRTATEVSLAEEICTCCHEERLLATQS